MKIRNALATLLLFVLGGAAGYAIPHRFQETIAQWKIANFHHCIAKLNLPRYRQLSWDASAQQRAMEILGGEADCINMSGIAGLSASDVECSSGYSMMPYDAYRKLKPPGERTPYVRSIVRTHRKPIDAQYCAGHVLQITSPLATPVAH